jgi:LCT (Lysosomal Cystine Transporter) family transporter
MYERKNQRVSYIARAIASVLILFLIVSSIVCIAGPLKTLDLLYYFSYVKLSITIMKYCPQAFMNFKRKSTEGWSIGNILLDFTGGVLSFIQMFLLAKNYNDWSSIFGSPTKLGLALFSIFFDVIFMAQHYICYRHPKNDRFSESDEIINEHSPILAFKK